MRLLSYNGNGDLSVTQFLEGNIPKYAILSHRWGTEEVTLQDLTTGPSRLESWAGYAKIKFCGEQARRDKLQYFWVDTCCIDKTTSAELTEAINSMFRWYQRATKCYVYLSDVQVPDEVTDAQVFQISWLEAFRQSLWFTRGWTLQELLAPATVDFFSEEGKRLGSRISLEREIHEITKIPIEVLRGQCLTDVKVEERLGWAAKRTTTLKEDKIYCLLGIFGVFLPVIYGEGEANATRRLRDEIQRQQDGHGIETLQDLTISPPNFAVAKGALDGEGYGNALLLMPHDGSIGPQKPSIWSLGSVAHGSRKDRYNEAPFARKIARFIGQSSILSEIDDKFHSLFSGAESSPCIVTLVGMGGIGKTQLALEYCKLAYSRKHNTFRDVFWFNASSEETLTTDFMKLSTLLAPPDRPFDGESERVEFVLSTLNSWRRRILIVFDNFDDPSFTNILDYIPNIGACGVLFTSRLREAGDEFGSMIEVPLMNRDDALQVLLSRLRLKDIPEGQCIDCQHVIDVLGCLPLALEQAAAYIASGGSQMSFGEFLKVFETRKKIIMETTPRFWKYTNISDPGVKSASLSILTTWDLSLDRLGSSSTDRAKKKHFFTVLCFLDPKRISRLFFRSYSNFFHELPVYASGDDWMSIFKSPTLPFDENIFRDVIAEMANLSLIQQFAAEVLGYNLVVTIHPLVRDWAQFRQSETERENFAREASCIVAGLLMDHHDSVIVISLDSMIPMRRGIDDWQYAVFLRDMMTEILAHMDTCVSHWRALRIKSQKHSSTTGDIFVVESLFANVYASLHQFDKSYEMLERTYSTTVTNLGEEHETSLKISVEMCAIRFHQGRGSEVQKRLEYLVEHPGAFEGGTIKFNDHNIAQFWLVNLYKAQGYIPRAAKLAKSLLMDFLLMDISDQAELKLFLAAKFANLLFNLDLQQDSHMLLQSLLTRYKRRVNFSPQMSSTRSKEIISMLELSLVEQFFILHERDGSMETLKEAESLLHSVDEYTSDHITPMNKFSLKIFHGKVFAARKLWPEAIEQTELAYRYSALALGPLHSTTIQWMQLLMKYHLRCPGKDKGHIVEIVTEALCAAAEQLGKTHEKVFILQAFSATLLSSEGQKRLALPLRDGLAQKMAQQFPPGDPKMIKAQSDLANCLYFLPDRSEAEAQRASLLYRNLIALEPLESKSEVIIKIQIEWRERLCSLLRKAKKYAEAIQLYKEAFAKQMCLIERDDINTWLIQQSIASCYYFQGEYHNALKILKEVEKTQVQGLGNIQGGIASSCYASTIHQMGLCYAELDFEREPTAYEMGKDCYERVLGMRLTTSNGNLSADVAAEYTLLGHLHRKRGRHMEAAKNYERACQFSRQERGEDFYFDMVFWGEALRLAGAWDEQKVVVLERLAWVREFRGPDSEETMLSIAALATNAECLKDLGSSLRYRKEELRLRQKLFEDKPGKTIDCMISISNLSYLLDEFATSRSMIMEVLQIRRTLDDYDSKDDIRFLADLAGIEEDMKNWEASMVYCRQIIGLQPNGSQAPSSHLAMAEGIMARCLFAQEKLDDAEAHASRALEIRETLFGDEHISTMRSRFWLASITFKQGNYEKAAQLFDRCLPSLRNFESPSQYWKNYWEQQISLADTSLSICRSRIHG